MKGKKRRRTDTTLSGIIRKFLICCICILALTGAAAGISYAGDETKEMALGTSVTTVALAHSEKKLELNIDEKTAATLNLSLPEKYKNYLYFLPAPLSSIFWLIDLIA